MEGFKKFVNILVMLYLVVGALIYLGILNLGQDSNPGFYTAFFLAGGALMLLELIVENLYIMMLKRGHLQHEQKINELKASLYDHKEELQTIRTKQAEEVTAVPPPPPTATAYTAATAPVTAAPTGTEPVPPVVKPADQADLTDQATYTRPLNTDPNVIITPGPTPGIQDPERRLPENTDT